MTRLDGEFSSSAIRPEFDESLTGFIRRLANAEGYRHLADFKVWLGHDYGRPLVEDLPSISAEFAIDLHDLEAISPCVAPENPLLEWRFHRVHRDPFCPVCLAQDRHWAQAWRHCFVTACPIHGVRLVDRCPRCNEPITPNSGGYLFGDCGHNLSEAETTTASCGEFEVTSMLSGKLGPMVPDSATGIQFDGDLNRLFQFLASHVHPSRTGKNAKNPLPTDIDETITFLEPVYRFLMDWPAAFDTEISERWTAATSGQTAAQRLGNCYQKLMSFEGEHGRAMADRVTAVVAERFGDPYDRKTPPSKASWLSAASAAAELGISAERIVSAVADRSIEGSLYNSGTGHRHTIIPREVVEKIRQDRARYLSGTAVRDLLGVSKKQWNLLGEAGVVSEVDPEDRPPLIDGSFDWVSIQATVETIANRTKVRNNDDAVMVKFSGINLRKTTDRRALLEVYRRIFKGEIRPGAVDTTSKLGEILFCEYEILEAFPSVDFGALTAQDISRLTGWKHECVTHWCSLGLLKSRAVERGPRQVWIVEHPDLCEFQSKYLVVAQIAKQQGTSSRSILARCERVGIETFGFKEVGPTSRGHLLQAKDLVSLI